MRGGAAVRVVFVTSRGDVHAGEMVTIPSVGDEAEVPEHRFYGRVSKRRFCREGRLNWYGRIDRVWVCYLMFEGNP